MSASTDTPRNIRVILALLWGTLALSMLANVLVMLADTMLIHNPPGAPVRSWFYWFCELSYAPLSAVLLYFLKQERRWIRWLLGGGALLWLLARGVLLQALNDIAAIGAGHLLHLQPGPPPPITIILLILWFYLLQAFVVGMLFTTSFHLWRASRQQSTGVDHHRQRMWPLMAPALIVLLIGALPDIAEPVHGLMLEEGGRLFDDPANNIQYFLLRADPERPDCNPDIGSHSSQQATAPGTGTRSLPAASEGGGTPAAAAPDLCKEKYAMYNQIKSHITPRLRLYRAMESTFFRIGFGAVELAHPGEFDSIKDKQ